MYRTDLSLLKEARPDVILTEVQGTRGAPEDIRAVESQLERALGKRPKVVHLAASDFEGALRHVAAVAEGIGAAEKGREVEKRMHQRVEAAKGACRGRRRRRVACIQWPDPIYPAGSWVPEMIRMAGGDDVLERQAAASGTVELQEVADARPEIVLMATCGVDRRANEQHARRLAGALPGARRDGVVGDRGGKKARFAACDGVGLLSRTGPQLVDALEMLVELFHPEAQGYGHGGRTFVWT